MRLLELDRNKRISVLAAHDFFQQLFGNPYSIQTLAAFYKNPLVEGNDLVGIYKRLVSSEIYDNSSAMHNSTGIESEKPQLDYRA